MPGLDEVARLIVEKATSSNVPKFATSRVSRALEAIGRVAITQMNLHD